MMNLKEIKLSYEKAVRSILSGMLDKGVSVFSNYIVDSDRMMITFVKDEKDNENQRLQSRLIYQINFNNETKEMAIGGIIKHYLYDILDITAISCEPALIDENFITQIKNGIITAMDHHEEINKVLVDADTTAKEKENVSVDAQAEAA